MSFEDYETSEAHERRITRCKSCRAQIIYLATAAGRTMPIDAATVEPDDDTYDAEKHVSHFSTCPSAEQHRRTK